MICKLCPRNCNAERTENTGNGFCRMPENPVLARADIHNWEENGNKASRKEYRMENLYLQEQWTYDNLGNVLSHRVYDSKDREQEAVEYLYFPDGKLDQETFYRGASSVSANYYIYDEAGRVIKKATGTPYEKFIDVRQNVLYTYDEHGNLLTEVTAKKDGTELSRREYTYISMELPVK